MLISSTGMSFVPANKKKPILNCHSAVLIDQTSGRILYGKNEAKLLAMASTTKIMTAIVAIEQGKLNDVVTVSKKAAAVSGSTAGLANGEKIKLEELLYGLMLRSGNDAAIAIAEHIAGSVENFSKLMTYKAIELGAYSTNFVSPHGLDDEKHFTTAYDLAKITSYCMKNKLFKTIVGTRSISSGITGNFNRSYSNINKFLFSFQNADGVKTGFTGNAGKCLVASASIQNERLISVILNSSNRFAEASKLINYGLQNFTNKKIMDKGKVCSIKLKTNSKVSYDCYLNNDVYIPLENGDSEEITKEIYVPSVVNYPLQNDSIVGNIGFFKSGVLIAKFPLYNREISLKSK